VNVDKPLYDDWGNTIQIGNQDLAYDSSNRHIGTFAPDQTSPTTSATYQRDVTGNIVSRTVTSVPAFEPHQRGQTRLCVNGADG
jgi:hypothetical protein